MVEAEWAYIPLKAQELHSGILSFFLPQLDPTVRWGLKRCFGISAQHVISAEKN